MPDGPYRFYHSTSLIPTVVPHASYNLFPIPIVIRTLNSDGSILSDRTTELDTGMTPGQGRKAEIHLGDEMGLGSDHQAGRSYGGKGQTPVIPGTGQRFRCKLLWALTNRGRLAFMVFKERFTAEVMITFLRRR